MAVIPVLLAAGAARAQAMPTGATPPSFAPDKDSLDVVQVLLAADVA